MRDPRVERLAKILVGYSTEVKEGEVVSIDGESAAEPLLLAVYEEVLEAGGQGADGLPVDYPADVVGVRGHHEEGEQAPADVDLEDQRAGGRRGRHRTRMCVHRSILVQASWGPSRAVDGSGAGPTRLPLTNQSRASGGIVV